METIIQAGLPLDFTHERIYRGVCCDWEQDVGPKAPLPVIVEEDSERQRQLSGSSKDWKEAALACPRGHQVRKMLCMIHLDSYTSHYRNV